MVAVVLVGALKLVDQEDPILLNLLQVSKMTQLQIGLNIETITVVLRILRLPPSWST